MPVFPLLLAADNVHAAARAAAATAAAGYTTRSRRGSPSAAMLPRSTPGTAHTGQPHQSPPPNSRSAARSSVAAAASDVSALQRTGSAQSAASDSSNSTRASPTSSGGGRAATPPHSQRRSLLASPATGTTTPRTPASRTPSDAAGRRAAQPNPTAAAAGGVESPAAGGQQGLHSSEERAASEHRRFMNLHRRARRERGRSGSSASSSLLSTPQGSNAANAAEGPSEGAGHRLSQSQRQRDAAMQAAAAALGGAPHRLSGPPNHSAVRAAADHSLEISANRLPRQREPRTSSTSLSMPAVGGRLGAAQAPPDEAEVAGSTPRAAAVAPAVAGEADLAATHADGPQAGITILVSAQGVQLTTSQDALRRQALRSTSLPSVRNTRSGSLPSDRAVGAVNAAAAAAGTPPLTVFAAVSRTSSRESRSSRRDRRTAGALLGRHAEDSPAGLPGSCGEPAALWQLPVLTTMSDGGGMPQPTQRHYAPSLLSTGTPSQLRPQQRRPPHVVGGASLTDDSRGSSQSTKSGAATARASPGSGSLVPPLPRKTAAALAAARTGTASPANTNALTSSGDNDVAGGGDAEGDTDVEGSASRRDKPPSRRSARGSISGATPPREYPGISEFASALPASRVGSVSLIGQERPVSSYIFPSQQGFTNGDTAAARAAYTPRGGHSGVISNLSVESAAYSFASSFAEYPRSPPAETRQPPYQQQQRQPSPSRSASGGDLTRAPWEPLLELWGQAEPHQVDHQSPRAESPRGGEGASSTLGNLPSALRLLPSRPASARSAASATTMPAPPPARQTHHHHHAVGVAATAAAAAAPQEGVPSPHRLRLPLAKDGVVLLNHIHNVPPQGELYRLLRVQHREPLHHFPQALRGPPLAVRVADDAIDGALMDGYTAEWEDYVRAADGGGTGDGQRDRQHLPGHRRGGRGRRRHSRSSAAAASPPAPTVEVNASHPRELYCRLVSNPGDCEVELVPSARSAAMSASPVTMSQGSLSASQRPGRGGDGGRHLRGLRSPDGLASSRGSSAHGDRSVSLVSRSTAEVVANGFYNTEARESHARRSSSEQQDAAFVYGEASYYRAEAPTVATVGTAEQPFAAVRDFPAYPLHPLQKHASFASGICHEAADEDDVWMDRPMQLPRLNAHVHGDGGAPLMGHRSSTSTGASAVAAANAATASWKSGPAVPRNDSAPAHAEDGARGVVYRADTTRLSPSLMQPPSPPRSTMPNLIARHSLTTTSVTGESMRMAQGDKEGSAAAAPLQRLLRDTLPSPSTSTAGQQPRRPSTLSAGQQAASHSHAGAADSQRPAPTALSGPQAQTPLGRGDAYVTGNFTPMSAVRR